MKIGRDKLDTFFEQNMSVDILYRPIGETRTADIVATPAGSRADAEQGQSVWTEIEQHDFIIRVLTPVKCQSDTFLRWLGREPLQNDEIIFQKVKYLVTPFQNGELFRYTSSYRTALRIHVTSAGTVR